MLQKTIHQELHCTIAEDKSAAVASSATFLRSIRQRLGVLAGAADQGNVATNIGSDFVAGTRIQYHARRGKRKERITTMRLRLRRLGRLRQATTGKETRRAGLVTSAYYAAEVYGISPSDANCVKAPLAQALAEGEEAREVHLPEAR